MINFQEKNRINTRFDILSKKNEHALICYVVGGFPDLSSSIEIITCLVKAGADIIEIGIPFSDPIADGSTIQQASYHSLLAGITPEKCLKICKVIRKRFPDLPIIAMTYSNILLREGICNFLKKSKASGIDGFILPDMTLEESDFYVEQATQLGLATIFLIAPNTSRKRLQSIVKKSSGFVYLVSVYGTTGARKSFDNYTLDTIKKVKQVTQSRNIPLAVGFGISSRRQAQLVINSGADAIIIGSAIINIVNSFANKKNILQRLQSFIIDMKKICR